MAETVNPDLPPIGEFARDTVQGRLDVLAGIASQYANLAVEPFPSPYGSTAGLDGVQAGITAMDSPILGDAPTATKPSPYVSQFQPVTMSDLAALRESLNLTPIARSVLSILAFNGIRPNLPDYADPTVTEVSIPQDVPPVGEVPVPVKPTLSLPSEESIAGILAALDAITVPELPALNRLTFDSVKPDVDLTPPDPLFIYNESTYQSDLKDATYIKLLHDIQYGGTGMSAETEQAFIDSAVDALDVELEKAHNDTFQFWGARGYEFPPGQLLAAVRQDTTANNRLKVKLVNDLAQIKYNAEQKWNEVALTMTLGLEKQWMDHINQVAQRSFEAAKYQVQYLIDLFNARVLAYNSRWEGYKTDAIVFGERVKAEGLEIERAKLLIESAGLSADLQEKKLRALLTRYESLKIVVALYAEEMNGAKLGYDLERLKLDGFKELIGAKVAQIGANTAKYNLHQAKLAGNETKARIYATDAEVYSKLVGAKKTEADIRIAELQADLEGNKQSVDILRAALEKYKADADVEATKEESHIKAYTAEVGAYEADTRLLSGFWDALTKVFQSRVAQMTAAAETAVKSAEVSSKLALGEKDIAAENARAAANIQAQIAASTISAVSFSTQVGYHESVSQSQSQSESDSNTTSSSISQSFVHSYDGD